MGFDMRDVSQYFSNLYSDLFLPVVVCANIEGFPVVYLNVRAGILFSPTFSALGGKDVEWVTPLKEMVRFLSEEEFLGFCRMANNIGHVDDYQSDIVTFDHRIIPVSISAKGITKERENDYFVIYFVPRGQLGEGAAVDYEHSISSIINSAFLAEDVDSMIQVVLALSGKHVDVSRVYVFEEVSQFMTRNTYEWCGEGVVPAIGMLQNLPKADYPYDVIINSGMFITDDVSRLQPEEREILEVQGIRSLAIITFYDHGVPIGYVGFDDCVKPRTWSSEEIQFLQSVASLLAVLIKRRDAERDAKRSFEIMQIISDHSEDIIYVNGIDDYRVKFVNRALAQSLGKGQEELIGRLCWEVFQRKRERCPFCPIPKLSIEPGAERSETYVWENKNDITGKTYFIKDNIIKWVDGQYVHVEMATDISQRLEYEERLRLIATYDSMTGVFNREWGGKLLADRLADQNVRGCLCFLDVDGLKKTNDNYGHDAGDSLLINIVKAIKRRLDDDEFICRWGGDEFLLWIRGELEAAEAVIKLIQEDMAKFNAENPACPYQLSFSYGIVQFEGETLDAHVTRADGLMYQNKVEKRALNKRRRKTD